MAKRFRFRLEKVLQYRKMIQDEKKKDLMIANNLLQEAATRLQDLENALLANELVAEGPLTVGEIELYGQYSKRLRGEIKHQKVRVQEAEESAREAREAYIEANKDAESLERLKQKRSAEYSIYLEKENEKFLDELTIQRRRFSSVGKE